MQRLAVAMLSGLLVCFAAGARAQVGSLEEFILVEDVEDGGPFATGALPLDRVEYEKLPTTPLHRDFLPAAVDLSDRFPQPGNQGRMGSCVGWAVGYAARSYYAHSLEQRKRNAAPHIASPSYIYHSIRPGDCDEGSHVQSALALLKSGAVSLAAMPYTDRICSRVTHQMQSLATDFRIKDYSRVDFTRPDQVKAQIAAGHPVVFATRLTPDSFHRARAGRIYHWEGRPNDSNGHAMTIVGYDDRRQAFRLINSWGRRWGDGGFLWMDYGTFTQLTDEAYVMVPEDVPVPLPRPKPPIPVIGDLDLAQLRCSRVAARREGDITVLSGFVGFARDFEMLEEKAKDKPYRIEVDFRPWPQCEALQTFEHALQSPHAPQLQVAEGRTEVTDGEVLPIRVGTPGHPTYLYLSYFQADGSVVNLHQPAGLVPAQLPAYSTMVFGTGKGGEPLFRVSSPFGREMVIAVTSRSPLFDKPLPRIQTEREYLTAMRKALIALPDVGGTPRVAAATVAAFSTREARQ